MSSRISIWGKAVAGNPVKRENNRRSPPESAPPPPAPPKMEAQGTGDEFRKPEVSDRASVYATPETWNAKFKKERPARAYTPSEFPPGRPRMKKEQRRRNTISIALSEEEENLVRAAAADKGVSMSDWARRAFFRYMGRKPPVRDMRRADWSKGPEILKEDDE